jgi:4-amino-4-deoxy-L-arabinose transferase-like glycosyltransferase
MSTGENRLRRPAPYPDLLSLPGPLRPAIAWRPWTLAGLVLLCLVPRVWMAAKIGGVYADGALYIHAAESLEAGDFAAAFCHMRLNVYPVVLAVLHRAGLEWELAAKWWGVSMACLAVLPLYGWVRRQFDDRAALAACFLYAVHPKLIQWSPEVMRDATFWFLLVLSVYLLWRAVTEVRLGFFCAAGPAVALSALTRSEGLFLVIPLVFWSYWRWRALGTARARLALGIALCVLAVPMLVVLVNIIWLHRHPRWELLRLAPFTLIQGWLNDTAVDGSRGTDLPRMARVFFPTMFRGISPAFGAFLLAGLWQWRDVWRRRDQQAIFYVVLALLGGVWIHGWHAHTTSTRYALPIVLLASPYAGLGLVAILRGIRGVMLRRHWSSQLCRGAVAGLASALGVLGWGDALAHDYGYRAAEASLGQWIGQEYGPAAVLLGPECYVLEVGYYARATAYEFTRNTADSSLLAMIRQRRPQMVLLSTGHDRHNAGEGLLRAIEDLGLERIDRGRLPAAAEDMVLFAARREAGPISRPLADRSAAAQSKPR